MAAKLYFRRIASAGSACGGFERRRCRRQEYSNPEAGGGAGDDARYPSICPSNGGPARLAYQRHARDATSAEVIGPEGTGGTVGKLLPLIAWPS
jgi:hypothetical protein